MLKFTDGNKSDDGLSDLFSKWRIQASSSDTDSSQ